MPKSPILTPAQIAKVRALAAQGLSQSTLATRFGVGRRSIRTALETKDPAE